MKLKPIDVGYKFFALNDFKTGWCYVVIPEGLADKEKEGKDGKKTWDKVAELCRHFSHIHLPKLEIKISLQQTSLHTATTSNYLTEDTTEEEDLCDELILSEILGVVKGDDEGPPWGQQRWN